MSTLKTKSVLRQISLTAALCLGVSSYALAHTHLVQQVPAAGSTVEQSPTELILNFSSPLESKLSKVELIGENNKAVKTGDLVIETADSKPVVKLPVQEKLEAGKYNVKWQAVSTDGHKSVDEYSFSVK